jgi:protein-tyrosine phosphatase
LTLHSGWQSGDFGPPTPQNCHPSVPRLNVTLEEVGLTGGLLGQASEGRRVEIGCAGGHGRTGTTLAGLLVLQGLSARSAIRRIRRAYCEEAIESREQEAFVRSLAG